jgi:hypothetical protein
MTKSNQSRKSQKKEKLSRFISKQVMAQFAMASTTTKNPKVIIVYI